MSSTVEFHHRAPHGAFQAVLTLVGIFPLMAIGHLVEAWVPREATVAALGALLVLAAAFYWLVRLESRLVVDATTVRLTERELGWFSAGPETTVWEIPRAELTHATLVATKKPSSRGGWDVGHSVEFPGGHRVRAELFGGEGTGDTAYDRLVAFLRAELGASLTSAERLA